MSDETRNERLTRRGFLGGIGAAAGAAILAACGGEEIAATATSAAPTVNSAATTVSGAANAAVATGTRAAATTGAVTTAVTGAATAVAPTVNSAATAVAPTVNSAATAVTTAATGAGTTAAGTAGGTAVSTGPFTLLPPPDANRFRGQTLRVVMRQEYFKEIETAQELSATQFGMMTGAKVEITRINEDQGQTVQKQDAAVKAGIVEDCAYFSRFYSQFQQLDDIVPVDDVVTEVQAAYGIAEECAKNPQFLNGKWYAVPYYTNGAGNFARKDWLAEKGIKIEDVKTYENMRDVALQISDPGKRRFGWGLTLNQSGDANGFIRNTIEQYGGAIANNEGTRVTFNSPETVAAVTFLADIYTNPKYKNMLPPGVESWTDTGNNEAWLAGTIGFTKNAFTLYAQSKAQKNPVYDATVTFPGVTGPGGPEVPIAVGGQAGFVIFKGAKQPDMAKAFIKYMIAGQPLLNVVKPANGLALPAYKRVWDSDPYYKDGDPVFNTAKEVVQRQLPIRSRTGGFAFPQSPSPGVDQAYNAYVLTDMMGSVVQKGTKPADAVKEANDRIVQAFNQLGIRMS